MDKQEYTKYLHERLEKLTGKKVVFTESEETIWDVVGSHPGARAMDSLVRGLGYDSMDHFFDDNSGATTAIVEWVERQLENNKDWARSLGLDNGTWVDPAGGTHDHDETDPARAYE